MQSSASNPRACCSLLLALLAGLLLTPTIYAQQPLVHLRADSLAVLADSVHVAEWQSTTDHKRFVADTAFVMPTLVRDGMNGKPTLRFANDGYLSGPPMFPVGKDYTLYVVMRWDKKSASNNLVSGTSHALYMGNTPYPRVLHNGNFTDVCVSSVPCNGPTIVRVEYDESEHRARIALNNVEGGDAPVPSNVDSTFYIGSYAKGNFFWGDIAEVILFDRLLDSTERIALELPLHARYDIPRATDPPRPVVRFTQVPSPLHFYPEGDSLKVSGVVTDDAVRRVDFTLDSSGVRVDEWSADATSEKSFSFARLLYAGLHDYAVKGVAELADGSQRELVNATSIVCGLAITIEGQSNSMYADPTLQPSPYARTFGSNFGQLASDTTFKGSIATSHGGGANVGAWGLGLQNHFAQELQLPTCVINGGVSGTRIELHFPDEAMRMKLSTIYGSWLYRLTKSGLRDNIRWLFWYQGESNSGGDGYAALFDKLYKAWQQDLPNLEHIVVVQIRPGCGGTAHALLRDDQRRFQDLYPNVIVHTACGLPGHDGCHFAPDGYRELAQQLFHLYRDVEAGNINSDWRAPTIATAKLDVTDGTVHVQTRYAKTLRVVLANGQPLRNAFFFNADEGLKPDSVWFVGQTIVMRPPAGLTISTVSYTPDKTDATGAIYEGPFIVDELGNGLITFYNIPVIPSSVEDHATSSSPPPQVVHHGDHLHLADQPATIQVVALNGAVCTTTSSTTELVIPPHLSPGLYAILIWEGVNVSRRLIAVQ